VTITVQLPDAVGSLLFASGREPTRAVLEAIALEGYRAEQLTESDVRQLLGFETGMEVHEFLKEHGAFMHYTFEDLEHDGTVAIQTAQLVQSQRHPSGNQPAE
jgi:hypothetical protein